MAIITIKGRIGYIQEAKGGLIISVAENKTNNLAKTKWHRVAIWGPKAKQIAKVIYKGAEFEFRCDWDTVTKNGKNYTNITVNTWKHIPKVEKVKVERSEDPDDWFVPPHRDPDSKWNRRYEGFQDPA